MRPIEFSRINVLFLIGLLLALGGCSSIFLFRGDLLYASVLFYFIGLAIVWWSGTGTFNKLMAFLLPAVVFITIYTVSQDVRVREAEVWLIPEGYTGPVYIFLGEKCGGEAIFEEKNRRYLFQEERVLFSQHKKNFGMTLQPEAFYYLGKNDERRPISLAVAERPTAPSADTLPVMAFPGQPIKGEAATGRYSLQYAFIGTYRDFTDHIRTSKLPDEAPEALIRRWEAFREDCGAR